MRGRARSPILTFLLLCMLPLCALPARADDVGRLIESQYGVYPDFATTLRVEYIGHRVALAAGLPNTTFHIFNGDDLNAEALPDGRVFITSRMATVLTDDEMAFVFGHELTHVKEHHARRQVEQVNAASLLGAVLVGVLGGPPDYVNMGSQLAGDLAYGHYSQQDEYRADYRGEQFMSQAGYDPARAPDAMQLLLDKYGRGDATTPVLGLFASHPDTKARKQRLVEEAAELKQHPLPSIPEPRGIAIALDPSAEHAAEWVETYLAIVLTKNGEGSVAVLPAPQYPIHPLLKPLPPAANHGEKDAHQEKTKDKKKDEPLHAVTVHIPPVPAAFRVTLALRQIPAASAATIDAGEGTAVEATIRWTQLQSGFSGACIATAQCRRKSPWMAKDELADPAKLYELHDGKSLNVEGTLEGIAVNRAGLAFAEILEANGPVDHSAPVTIATNTEKLRLGDYIGVQRGNEIVAEVQVLRITGKKEVIGAVLWGTHTWKKKDKFIHEDN